MSIALQDETQRPLDRVPDADAACDTDRWKHGTGLEDSDPSVTESGAAVGTRDAERAAQLARAGGEFVNFLTAASSAHRLDADGRLHRADQHAFGFVLTPGDHVEADLLVDGVDVDRAGAAEEGLRPRCATPREMTRRIASSEVGLGLDDDPAASFVVARDDEQLAEQGARDDRSRGAEAAHVDQLRAHLGAPPAPLVVERADHLRVGSAPEVLVAARIEIIGAHHAPRSAVRACRTERIGSRPVLLRKFPPMGVYETLFRFADATHKYMGDPGTHPWAQGFPITTPVPGGPSLPDSIAIGATDRMYPKADGQPPLREAIAAYYREFYGARITADNVAVFAGGRPAIFAILAFLLEDVKVAIEETEYTPYYDLLKVLRREHVLIPSNVANRFRPTLRDHPQASRVLLVRSNPCNPTGVVTAGEDLERLVASYSQPGRGALIDEAYEFFCDPEPVSALRYVRDIDATDLFVVGAATKGLQVPGMRVGWVIASREHVEIFRNYSSFAMGGVSRASQLYVTQLLALDRVRKARQAIASHYGMQRRRYGEAMRSMGFELFTGDGGFYHWARLPKGITGDAFNERLFAHDAGILPGRLCDMARRGDAGPLGNMIRFSFGPLPVESFEGDVAILRKCV